jgi:outer membrane receptor protein involved in Fe transport
MTMRISIALTCILSFVFAGWPGLVHAQQKLYTVSGYVKDSVSGEALINVSLLVQGTTVAIQSNSYGYFSLSIPAGQYTLLVSYAGFQTVSRSINLNSNLSLNLNLSAGSSELQKVVVTGERQLRKTNTVALGIQQLSIAQIRKIPAFMGEPDIVKSLLTLPGVTSVGEGASGFNVRGGNVDENLILLDEAPVYNSSHLLGFFSVFNPDAVKNVTLYKGAFPAEYGGRTSSVLDIRMKEGNNQKLSVNGGIGNIFSRITLEGPIQRNKSSFIVAARRSYIDVLAKPFLKGDNTLYFYDLTAKGNVQLNENNTLYLSGYLGRDVFGFGSQASFKWGNSTASLRWNHLFSRKLFLNTSMYYSKYDYNLIFNTTDGGNKQRYDWKSNIQTVGLKPSFTWFVNSRHQVKAGASLIFYNFYPGKGVLTSGKNTDDITLIRRYGTESALYAEDTWKLTPRLTVQAGIRLTRYDYLGHTRVYFFKQGQPNTSKPLDHEEYVSSSAPVATYPFTEPRLSLRYEWTDLTILKAGFSRSSQFIHLLSNTASATPVDLYFPGTNNIKPSSTNQYSVGAVQSTSNRTLEFSAEIFYKRMSDLVDFIDNANLQLNQLVEADLITGKGKSYGLEAEVKKDKGKWQGSVNYTWSRSFRKSPGISNDQWYLSQYDRTHVFNAVAVYSLSAKWEFSGAFNYGSGTPATFPDVRLDIQGLAVPYNSTGLRNGYRLPAYHRLDVSATLKGRQGKKMKQQWVFGIYNLYARQNAYTIYFRQNPDDPSVKEAVRLSIIGSLIPSITWNFKF